MGLTPSISSSDSIALDTNIFIYGFGASSPHHHSAISLLDRIIHVSPKTYVSALVFTEFLIQIYKQGQDKNLAQYENFLTAGGLITVVDINRDACRTAAHLRSQYSTLKTPDALHLACALHAPAKKFLTFDRRLPRKIGQLTILPLA